MQTSSDIVEKLGGTLAVARALDLTPSVVSSWRTSNSIPRWWHAQLIALSGGQIDASEFPVRRRAAA